MGFWPSLDSLLENLHSGPGADLRRTLGGRLAKRVRLKRVAYRPFALTGETAARDWLRPSGKREKPNAATARAGFWRP